MIKTQLFKGRLDIKVKTMLFQDNKEGIEKTGDVKMKKESEMSGAESTRSTSRTREKSHRSDKVSLFKNYC